MSDNTVWGYDEQGIPKLGNNLGTFYLYIFAVLLVVLLVTLGCIPAIFSWFKGTGFVHPFFDHDDESD